MKTKTFSSFLILFLAGVLLLSISSCSTNDTEILPEVEAEELQTLKNATNQSLPELTTYKEYFLPIGFDKASEEEIAAYKESMTIEMLDELVEHTKIADYLVSIGQAKRVVSNLSKGDLLTSVDLTNYLSSEQINNLATYDGTVSVESRGCTAWEFAGCSDVYNGCCFPLCYVNFICEEKRECDWWDLSARYRTTYKGPIHACH